MMKNNICKRDLIEIKQALRKGERTTHDLQLLFGWDEKKITHVIRKLMEKKEIRLKMRVAGINYYSLGS